MQEVLAYHLMSRSSQPISALPGIRREFAEMYRGEMQSENKRPPYVRVVFVYILNSRIICRRPSWKRSERDVLTLYQQNPKANPQEQVSFYKGKPLKAGPIPRGTTRPDLVLAPGAIGAFRLPKQNRLDFEIVEVKRLKATNLPSAKSGILKQINARAGIKLPNGLTGKYQSLVLDFRGQEGQCELIRESVEKLAKMLKKEAKGVISILIQVLLWKGPNCKALC